MTRSRALAALIVALIVALVTACSGGGDDGDGGGGDGGGGAATTEELEGTITVRFMGDPQDIQQTLADEFMEENPNVTVEVQNLPWDGGHDVLVTEISGGETPDAGELGNTWTREFADLGGLAPLDDVDVGDVPEGLAAQGRLDGTQYGAFWFGGARALIYRTDLFEQAGITEPPDTWEDIAAICETFKAEFGTDVYAMSLAGGDQHSIIPLLWAFGADLVNDDGEPVVNSPEAAEAWSTYADLYNSGCSPKDSLTWNSLDAQAAIAAGQTAMFIGGGWDVDTMIDDNPDIEANLGTALLPAGPAGRETFAGGSHLVVFEASDNKPAAKAWVQFMMQPDNVSRYIADLRGFFPGTTEGIQQTAEELGPLFQPFAEMLLENTRSYPLGAPWGAIEGGQVFRNALQSVMTGDASAEEALASVEETMKAEF